MSTATHGGAMADGSGGELAWYQDKRCESGACVEVAVDGDTVLLRSSKNQRATPVALSRDEWREFITGAKDGVYDWIG
jgi:hypothetical protein